jgi:hypothetical protein
LQLIVYLSIIHNKIDSPGVLCRIGLLIPKRLSWDEKGTVALQQRPRLLWQPPTRTSYAAHAPTVRAVRLINDMLMHNRDVDIFADSLLQLRRDMLNFVDKLVIY